jgi:deazaflavin-dependent oxidoreductase (nitroreductase family)
MRTALRAATVATIMAGAAVASPVVMPRILRRHPDWLKLSAVRRYTAFRCRRAGGKHSVTALLTHTGRRSGRAYQTALGARPYGDGFVVSLPYGTRTDWYRNVVAAGMCTLTYRGQVYRLERPQLVADSQALDAWPPVQRILVQGGGIREFLWLHRVSGDGR